MESNYSDFLIQVRNNLNYVVPLPPMGGNAKTTRHARILY